MEKILEKLMDHAEECLKEYSKKDEWHEGEMECAYKAAKLYETLQTIKMNNGIWDEMKGDSGTSEARMPRIYYGPDSSQMRGRDANTGRYMSRANRGYNDYGRDDSYMDRHNMSNGYYDEGMHGNSNRDGNRSMHSIKDRAIDSLERMFDKAQTDHEKQKLDEFIRLIERTEV